MRNCTGKICYCAMIFNEINEWINFIKSCDMSCDLQMFNMIYVVHVLTSCMNYNATEWLL